MKKFGETIRELRNAQGLGLRETAVKVGISPAYLSRIERDKESPPRPEIIKGLARLLAADPDVLFRLSLSTDPDITDMLRQSPKALELVRFIIENKLQEEDIERLITFAKGSILAGCFPLE
ncbi:helix-turn-helix transcriptional regulator [Desulforhabdus sp. TSK]|uniref:helix-turn-helix domain-containing protein n=1 Tax=Desulforhabdus sp. TSK TaxID=2925014 RepID=UPI001FC7E84A|nr:helix-turn-helix transcriptional regulator [Desulforhabdus sp. TSK]GKT09780.1 hypothetical protein DSTSK_30850 [Desulforhabdus sp. TSK]